MNKLLKIFDIFDIFWFLTQFWCALGDFLVRKSSQIWEFSKSRQLQNAVTFFFCERISNFFGFLKSPIQVLSIPALFTGGRNSEVRSVETSKSEISEIWHSPPQYYWDRIDATKRSQKPDNGV